ncbi:MAG TPA: cyclic nucleotide-binding domain-containing protein [Accumulibacter sp.]|jgi:CRP-like cAMP-binding protein|nr:cyclic nucleotide-binding domain-containing protein [Accumulibacter sp.]
MQTIKFLQDQPLFGGVGEAAMQAIMPLLRDLDVPAGGVIVKEDDEGDSLYVIYRGAVEVLKSDPDADDPLGKRIAVLKVGDVFGEMELIDMQRRSATVRAMEPVSVLALSNGDMLRIYESDMPTFTLIVMNLARELSRRLRNLDTLAAHYLGRDRESE